MKPEIALRWAEALESGKYTQTSGTLCLELSDGQAKYCCLGVLCELAIEDGVPVQRTREKHGPWVRFDSKGGVLPPSVREWAGTGTDDIVQLGEDSAIGLNDGQAKSFPEIAQAIRTHLVGAP